MIEPTVWFSSQVWTRGFRFQRSRWLPKRPSSSNKMSAKPPNLEKSIKRLYSCPSVAVTAPKGESCAVRCFDALYGADRKLNGDQ
jgi:hypothetical protein